MTGAMIAFASCVADPATYARHALPGLRDCAEPDSLLIEATTDRSIFEAYNEVLEHCASLPDLEAVVLHHEDTEIVDPAFCDRVRAIVADESVAVAGPVGAAGVRQLAWWESEIIGHVTETRGTVAGARTTGDVDALDGLLLVLAPWTVRTLRFDAERFTGFHGYDVDLCLQARAAGRRVVAADLRVHHHTTPKTLGADFAQADAVLRAKWGFAPVAARQAAASVAA